MTDITDTAAAAIPAPKTVDTTQSLTAKVLRLHKDTDMTQTQIAQQLGCAQSWVSTILSKYADRRSVARGLLENQSVKLAETVLNGNSAIALKALQGLSVLAVTDGTATGVQVTIGGSASLPGPGEIVVAEPSRPAPQAGGPPRE